MIVTTHTERRLVVEDQVAAEHGRVAYRVDRVGTFTLYRDPLTYGAGRDAPGLRCTYGLDLEPVWHHGTEPLPEAPVVFGVTLVGATVFDPDRRQPESPWWLVVRRPVDRFRSERAPERTCARVSEIVGALTEHYLGRADRFALEHAQAVSLAPGRLREHERHLADLDRRIAALRQERDQETARAQVQAVLCGQVVAA